jgi:hypothetical protein
MKKEPFKTTPRIDWKNGAWYYRPKTHEKETYNGKSWYRIGDSISDVYKFLADKAEREAGLLVLINTIDEALTKYQGEIVPLKGFKSREGNRVSIKRLRATMGHLNVHDVTLAIAVEHRNAVGKKIGRGAANADIEVLSHLYSVLILWSVIKNWEHPIRGNKIKFPSVPRERYVEHDEIIEAHKFADKLLKIYIPFRLKTSLDQKSIMSILMSDVAEEGIYYKRVKLNRYDTVPKSTLRLILWDDELKILADAVNGLRADFPERSHLFCNTQGNPYIDKNGTASPFRKGPWRRFRAKLKKEGLLEDNFTEHDLRAKSLSDEEDESIAIKRGDHSIGKNTTSRVYRRKAEKVQPLHLESIGLGELMEL